MATYLISDVHGHIDGLLRALEKHKIISANGERQLARRHQVVQIGDLANCVYSSKEGDLACLKLIEDGIIDSMIIGNHEIPYFDPTNQFGGFNGFGEIETVLRNLYEAGKIKACMTIGDILVTHAGLSKQNVPPVLRGGDGIPGVHEVAEKIEWEWAHENFAHNLFSDVGYARCGCASIGGIVWCDFDSEFIPTPWYPQIVGHTIGGVRMKGNALCIDVGAKNGYSEPFIMKVEA